MFATSGESIHIYIRSQIIEHSDSLECLRLGDYEYYEAHEEGTGACYDASRREEALSMPLFPHPLPG